MMTLGQCLDLIRKQFLEGDREQMTRVGMHLIRRIKLDYFPDRPYPKEGWNLMLSDEDVMIFHLKENCRLKVELSVDENVLPVARSKAAYKKLMDIKKDQGKGAMSKSYSQKVLDRKRQMYVID